MVTCYVGMGNDSLPPLPRTFLVLSRVRTLPCKCVTLFNAQAGLTLVIAREQLQSLRKAIVIPINIPKLVVKGCFALCLNTGPKK